jgi:hypothetical protein
MGRDLRDLIIIYGIQVRSLSKSNEKDSGASPITEPLDSDLMKQVEYDMDEQGTRYLILYDRSNEIP